MAQKDLKKKVAELIRSNRYSKFITFGTDGAPHGRVMTSLPLDNDMVIWFATGLSTNKIKHLPVKASRERARNKGAAGNITKQSWKGGMP